VGKISLIIISLLCGVASAGPLDEAKERCGRPGAGDKLVSQRDFHWNMTPAELQTKFKEIYSSGKRLFNRAYFDESKAAFILQRRQWNSLTPITDQLAVPERFLLSVISHIEGALRLNYVEAILFPDMGHSHFLIPDDFYKREIEPLPAIDHLQAFAKMFDHPELKVLYHTGEQLNYKAGDGLVADPKTQWRYYIRNLVGSNSSHKGLEIHFNDSESFNTVRNVPGYFYWGAGFNISASKDGCFPYQHKGQTYYFDLSLEDLTAD
jgi:hypothetical protein